jgi:hypothetical protein
MLSTVELNLELEQGQPHPLCTYHELQTWDIYLPTYRPSFLPLVSPKILPFIF